MAALRHPNIVRHRGQDKAWTCRWHVWAALSWTPSGLWRNCLTARAPAPSCLAGAVPGTDLQPALHHHR